MDSFVTSTKCIKDPDDTEPPPPPGDIGKLPKKCAAGIAAERKGRAAPVRGGVQGLDKKEKNAGTEQFRYLVKSMYTIEQMLKGGEKTLKDFHAEVRSWSKLVKDQDAASVYETTGR